MSEEHSMQEASAPPVSEEVPYSTIANALKAGLVVPFLGAAASAVFRPFSNETPNKLAKWKLGEQFLPFGPELAGDLAELGKIPGEKRHDLPLIASYYANVNADHGLLNHRLHQIFDIDCKPGKLHELLAAIEQPLLIVTTNYDDMMERALDQKKRPYYLVVDRGEQKNVWLGKSDGEGLGEFRKIASNKLTVELSAKEQVILYKIHGNFDHKDGKNDHFLITEEDYLNVLARGDNFVPPPIVTRMDDKRFLFLGYGLYDWNVRVLLWKLRKQSKLKEKDRRSWAIIREPPRAHREIWKQHGVKIFDCDLLDFSRELAQEFELHRDAKH